MLRFNRMVCLLLVCSLVGVAFAKAIKVTALVPEGNENVDADGMVIINFQPGTPSNEVQVMLSDFTPDKEYLVLVGSLFGRTVLQVTTNGVGNGSGHKSSGGPDITDGGNACMDVIVFFDGDGDFFPDSDVDEIRATGSNCP